MIYRNGKEIDQIYRNGKEIALLYRNGAIIYDKRVQSTVELSYVTENQNVPFLVDSERGSSATFTITSQEPTWANHTFLGWSPTEHDYNIIYNDGDSITISDNTTLYAVWSVSFQGLIDEGFVTIEDTTPSGRGVALTVSPNCPYPKNKVTDFNDVFDSTSKVSLQGVVGEGTLANVFLWPTSHWLTDDEVYTLYNDVQLAQDVVGLQFRFLNWKNKQSVTIKYAPNSGGYYYTDSGVFGPNMPETINFNVGGRWFSSTHEMFGRHNRSGDTAWTPMSNTVTFNWVTTRDGGYNFMNDASGMFELASKLQTITGLNFRNARNVQNTFDGCSSLVTIPASLASSGMNSLTTMGECFRNCTSLVEIVPVMNVENVTSNANVFKNDAALTSIKLYHINASKNKDWHLEDTNLDQTSIDYIITNVYESVDTSAEGFTYRNIYFPSGANVSYDQYARLYEYGWNVYLGSEPYPIAL